MMMTSSTPMLLLLLAVSGMDLADAFVGPSSSIRSTPTFCASTPHRHRTVAGESSLFMMDDLFSDVSVTVKTSAFQDSSLEKAVDKNGKEFVVGAVVRVCVEGLKAYQISAKGQGSYDDDKNFVQYVSDFAGRKSLLLPAGLRGTVNKVYDEDVVSANLPIQVKFVPGTNTEEGYDAPTALLMHFTPQELECV